MRTKISYGVIVIFVTIVILEISARIVIAKGYGPDVEAYSSMKQNEPRFIAQPFLNYMNNPRFIGKNNFREINSLGIRNVLPTTPEKKVGTYRILFLGGSTTYGM